MVLLSATVFQLPIPPILFLVPPSHPVQCIIRLFYLIYTLTIALPLILLFVPISLILNPYFPTLVLLPLHPDNVPPRVSVVKAIFRGVLVYSIGTIIWAITGVGNAPELDERTARRLSRLVCWLIETLTRYYGTSGRLVTSEELVLALEDGHRTGVIRNHGESKEMTMFKLDYKPDGNHLHLPSPSPYGPEVVEEERKAKKAILFLAGGGYVTGIPLAHPFIFSLSRRLSSDYTIYTPMIRKSLDINRSFPIPLIDALAAYQHLRKKDFAPENIIVMGDSAGGGLVWSLMAYLAILRESTRSDLGQPGRMIMISPWLSLPPTIYPLYPDLVNEPQLFNATRCYLARFPLIKTRPDPFSSDTSLWCQIAKDLYEQYTNIVIQTANHLLPPRLHLSQYQNPKLTQFPSKTIIQQQDGILSKELELDQWLDTSTFQALSSHHPLISPSTNHSTFVDKVLHLLQRNNTRMLVHAGTAEWFHAPAITMARWAKEAGIDVRVEEEKGAFHCQGCVLPAEISQESHGMSICIVDFLENSLESG